jgi:GNAT superfamily N-acetyltransferase
MSAPHSTRDRYTITTDPARLDVDAIHAYLARSYWAEGIPRELVQRSIDNSLCFGLFDGMRQVGFARVITDRATFAYLCDVYVLEEHRGAGLGKWLIETVMSHPEVQGLRRWMLMTRDAHGLYAQHGFTPLAKPPACMELARPGLYLRADRSE